MKREIRLVIVDDHPVFRHGLRQIIETHPPYKVVGEASEGGAGLQLVSECRPDIAVVDVDMPRGSGLDLARSLKRNRVAVDVIILTMFKDEDIFNAALDLGVKAYVLKENAVDEILTALEKVSTGGTFFSQSLSDISRRREDLVQKLLVIRPRLENLTAAERRILRLIAEEHTSKEIADLLKISVKTVDNHRLNICHKLNVHGSHGLLKFAFDHRGHL
jgi:DNA-binding NarL/FixJ family response regulator